MTAPTIDGFVTGNGAFGQTASFALPGLTTTQINDVIVVAINFETDHTLGTAASVTSVTATGLTFTKRGSQEFTDVNGNFNTQEIWWAPATLVQVGVVITINTSVAIDDGAVVAFGVNGAANISSPWDVNGSLPAFTAANSGTPTATFSTTAANCLVFQFHESIGGIATTSPWTQIAQDQNSGGVNFCWTNVFSEGVTSAQSGASSTMTPTATTSPILFAVDAIAGAGGGSTFQIAAALAGVGATADKAALQAAAKAGLAGVVSLGAVVTGPIRATAALAGTGTLAAKGALSLKAASSLAGVGTVSAKFFLTGSAALAGVGSLSATAGLRLSASAALAGGAAVAANFTAPAQFLSASLAGGATVGQAGSGSGTPIGLLIALTTAAGGGVPAALLLAGGSTIAGLGSLTAAFGTAPTSAALAGSGSLSGKLTLTAAGSAALAGLGAITASGVLAVQDSGAAAGSGNMSAKAAALMAISANLAGGGNVGVAASGPLGISAALTGSAAVAARLVAQEQISAALNGVGTLSFGATGRGSGGMMIAIGIGIPFPRIGAG